MKRRAFVWSFTATGFLAALPALAADPPSIDVTAKLVEAFAGEHARRYGYRDDDAAVELVNIRVSVWGTAPPLRPTGAAGARPRCGEAEVIFDGGAARATVLRGELHSGTRVAGPALCALPHASLLIPPGWSGEVDRHGTCCLERIK